MNHKRMVPYRLVCSCSVHTFVLIFTYIIFHSFSGWMPYRKSTGCGNDTIGEYNISGR